MDSTQLIKEALESYNNYPIDKHDFSRKYDKASYLSGYYDARLKVSRVELPVKPESGITLRGKKIDVEKLMKFIQENY